MKQMQKCGLPEHKKKARPGSVMKRTGWNIGNAECYASSSQNTLLNQDIVLLRVIRSSFVIFEVLSR